MMEMLGVYATIREVQSACLDYATTLAVKLDATICPTENTAKEMGDFGKI